MEDILKQIKELCSFEELYHDGINLDIKSLCDKGLGLLEKENSTIKVVRNGKELYHIQNRELGSDGVPLDMFVWLDHFPTEKDLRALFSAEYENLGGEALDCWLTSSEIFNVWAEEL